MIKKNFIKSNDVLLFACFARSYDAEHLKRKRIHLISSVVASSYEIDLENLNMSFLREKIENGMYRSTYYIFNVVDEFSEDITYPLINVTKDNNILNINRNAVHNYFNCIRVINISYATLLTFLEYDGKIINLTENFTKEIFGDIEIKDNKFNSICQDSVFIFRNVQWNWIVLLFKLYGIDISGGSSPRRHILSSVEATLKEFLDLFYGYNTDFINKFIIYESFKNKNGYLSSFIDLKNYKNMLDVNIEIKGLLFKNIKWSKFKEILEEYKKIILGNSSETEDTTLANKFLFNQYLFTFPRLVWFWKSSNETYKSKILKKDLKNLENDLTKTKSNVDFIKNFYNYYDDFSKKILDENYEGNFLKINLLEEEIKKIKHEIYKEDEKLEEKISDKNIIDLYDMVTNLDEVKKNSEFRVKGIFKNKYPRRNKLDNFNYLKREYSTFSNSNFYSNSNFNSNSNHSNSYLDSEEIKLREDFLIEHSKYGLDLKHIVNRINRNSSEYDKKEVQELIERFSIDYQNNFAINIIKNSNVENQYDKLFLTLMSEWYKKIVKGLENFINEYEINGYEKLITDMKKKKIKPDFFLLVFAFKYKIMESNKKNEIKYEENLEKFKYLKLKKDNNFLYDYFIKNYKREYIDIINIVINVLAQLIINKYNKSEDYLGITQHELINNLGKLFLKRVPKKLPALFLDSNKDWDNKTRDFINDYYNSLIDNISDEIKNRCGNNLLELVIEKTDLLDMRNIRKKGKLYNYISIKQKYLFQLNKHLALSDKLPMVFKPKEWEFNDDGGYYNSELKDLLIHSDLMHYNKRNLYDSIFNIEQRKAHDYVSGQKFKINNKVLTFMLKEFNKKDKSIFFEGCNIYKSNLSTINLEEFNKEVKLNIISQISKCNLYKRILSLAIVYENVDFYIPTFMDFRGRIYSGVDYLNYQGEDVARSLIEFSKGCDINEKNIIYVLQQLANTAGKSKLNIENKNKWAITFINQLNVLPYLLRYNNKEKDIEFLNINYKNGFDFKIEDLLRIKDVELIISNSNEKLQFITVLYSLIRTFIAKKNNKNNFKFNTPICFDATCSGFQHLSALFRDISIAVESNVLNNPNTDNNNEPGDIYTRVSEVVKKKVNEIADYNVRHKLLKLKIDRKLLKKPVMTVPYNVGMDTMLEQLIKDKFFEKKYESFCAADEIDNKINTYYIVSDVLLKEEYKEDKVILSWDEMYKFNSILYWSVYDTFPSLEKYVKYLNNFATLFGVLDLPMEWKTPAAMVVVMGYGKYFTKQVRNDLNKKRSSVSLPIIKKIDTIANKTAFMPNFIHSLDSANIYLLINDLIDNKININLFTIHDCFASTPESMELVNIQVRLAFSKMYFDQDYLKVLHKSFLSQIQNKTQIFKYSNNILTKYEFKNEVCNGDLVILVKDKKFIKIPPLPVNNNWDELKSIFKEGIEKSLHFIN